MLRLSLGDPTTAESFHVLALGAHADDIEIGCGGTIMRLLHERPGTVVTWVVMSALGQRSREAKESAEKILAEAYKRTVVTRDFRDGYFPYLGAGLKDVFEDLMRECSPDVIFTHRKEDLHQDHRLISELTWQTFRDHLILEYEVPKYDGDFASPNVFSLLSEELSRRKTDHLMAYFPSQRHRRWFTAETFLSILRLRGMEANSPTGYAEGFSCRKLVLL
jgi:LmbE family N-acetylglucosaminyl deacetylase